MSLVNYIYLATILFAIGGAAVLVRRNAIIVFMGVELMLNATNLAFVTFARMHGSLDGQVIALFVMVVAAAEVVVGPRHHHGHLPCPPVGLGRRRQPAEAVRSARRANVESLPCPPLVTACRRDQPRPRGSRSLSWLLVALPLLGAAVLLLGGRRTDKFGPAAGHRRCPGPRFVVGAAGLPRDARPRPPTDGPSRCTSSTGCPAGSFKVEAGLLDRPALDGVRAAGDVRRVADPRLLPGLHGARPGQAPLLRLPQPVRRLDAPAGARRLLPAAVRRLGGRRPRVVPADRLLELQPGLRVGGQQGVRRQPRR